MPIILGVWRDYTAQFSGVWENVPEPEGLDTVDKWHGLNRTIEALVRDALATHGVEETNQTLRENVSDILEIKRLIRDNPPLALSIKLSLIHI